MIYNPTTILKCLSTQATYIKRQYRQMFYYTDKREIWYDTQNNARLFASDITILVTEKERNNYIPERNNLDNISVVYVYVVETNALYQYNLSSRTWTTIYGTYGSTTVAQTYLPNGNSVIINADDVTTNGILNDGSVVIRDNNKMICGLLQSNGYTMNIKGLIGGQINIDPSDIVCGDGCLQINSDNSLNINNDLTVFGSINIANRSDWNKQYRLITEDINITNNTTIAKGSTIATNSELNGFKYGYDTKLTEDLVVNGSGLITTGSKIYINSIINNEVLKPPYLFDTNIVRKSFNISVDVNSDQWALQKSEPANPDSNTQTLMLNIPNIFNISGDTCYIDTTQNVLDENIINVIFSDGTIYSVSYINITGTDTTARIIYYKSDNSVKIIA